jgi:hypothetical protein
MHTGGGVVPADADTDALWGNGHVVNLFLDGCWFDVVLVDVVLGGW